MEWTTNVGGKKRKADVSTTEIDQIPLFDIDHKETIQTSFCDAATQTEITVENLVLDQIEAELNKEIREKKGKVAVRSSVNTRHVG